MSDQSRLRFEVNAPPTTRWSVGGLLLESLSARDFALMFECFAPRASMRALLPSGAAQFLGAAKIVESFKNWFGGAEGFEVIDGTVGAVGSRLHVAWRLRVRPTPMGGADWHVIEQQAYVLAGDRIDALDLLCSGFMPDRPSVSQAGATEHTQKESEMHSYVTGLTTPEG